ncbi:helix-turn-helix transcriptional regulator [Roseateles cellulosilyticus]|uniref:Autoinducer binding domain-containing protein n=1 Tax=Pelomonas cellulosilytica TaxID=2906762 RepID=A0ABS8XTN4_9BURK|nr:autoinducer binding domain-containing protein [Pelomonas sp. P8]MCE4556069.1 autoinducer binding domain-containing protein [Pelomonas sp. P8]
MQFAFVGGALRLPTLVAPDAQMNLQRYEQVSQAKNFADFRQGLIDFAHDMDFGLIAGVLAIERGVGGKSEYIPIGNTPPEFLAAASNAENAQRDPVHRHVMRNAAPLIYDQRLYVDAGAGDLWEMQAPFGYRTGLAVSVHMPGYRRFLLGVDRERPLPTDPVKLSRMLADLQLLAVHAQDAASRLLMPVAAPKLSARQLEILRLTMDGKSAWVVGSLLGISENTVNYHMKQLFRALDVSTKNHAVLKAMELGLL